MANLDFHGVRVPLINVDSLRRSIDDGLSDRGMTLVDQRLIQLQEYWESKHRGDLLPARSDLLPEEIHHLLPSIIIYDVLRPDQSAGAETTSRYRYRVRLIGTEVVRLHGEDTTGQYLEQTVVPSNYENVYQRLTRAVDERAPQSGESRFYKPSRDFMRFCYVDLPLASDGIVVDMILGARFMLD
jgi:hypothetical protein